MASRVAVDVDGAKQLAQAFRQMAGPGARKGLRSAHVETSRFVTTKSKASPDTAQQQRASRALLGKGTQDSGYVAIRNMASMPFGIGAYIGAKRYKQFPDWVGNTWNLEAGQGPYVIAPVIGSNMEEIKDIFLDMLQVAAEAVGLDWKG